MKTIYIAHPISGNVPGNLAKIIAIIRTINLTMPDVVPMAPYYTDILALNDAVPAERKRGIANDTHIIKTCIDELWVYGDYENSIGCMAEIALCQELHIPVHFKQFTNQNS